MPHGTSLAPRQTLEQVDGWGTCTVWGVPFLLFLSPLYREETEVFGFPFVTALGPGQGRAGAHPHEHQASPTKMHGIWVESPENTLYIGSLRHSALDHPYLIVHQIRVIFLCNPPC